MKIKMSKQGILEQKALYLMYFCCLLYPSQYLKNLLMLLHKRRYFTIKQFSFVVHQNMPTMG